MTYAEKRARIDAEELARATHNGYHAGDNWGNPEFAKELHARYGNFTSRLVPDERISDPLAALLEAAQALLHGLNSSNRKKKLAHQNEAGYIIRKQFRDPRNA
tara:strand:+ start:1517 stop:1825 length:309 start_codon:yes stop_codon:yes gene_type:complete